MKGLRDWGGSSVSRLDKPVKCPDFREELLFVLESHNANPQQAITCSKIIPVFTRAKGSRVQAVSMLPLTESVSILEGGNADRSETWESSSLGKTTRRLLKKK